MPIPCCKPWNISKLCFLAVRVHRSIFNFIFSSRFWGEAVSVELIYCQIAAAGFSLAGFSRRRQQDNTIPVFRVPPAVSPP
jgi:formate-dependent nitrite reductase membrane component NrfD